MNTNLHIKPGTLPVVKVFNPTPSRDWEFISTELQCEQGGTVCLMGSREDTIKAAQHILKELDPEAEFLIRALECIEYSMRQAQVLGNDYRREIALSGKIAKEAIEKAKGEAQ